MTPKEIEELQIAAEQGHGMARFLKKLRLHFAEVEQADWRGKKPAGPLNASTWPGNVR